MLDEASVQAQRDTAAIRFPLRKVLMKFVLPARWLLLLVALTTLAGVTYAQPAKQDKETVRSEHDMIGLGKEQAQHTTHPDAQWYPDAAFGLFLHWDESSVRAMNISWPMIPGRPLAKAHIDDPKERERIIREGDWNLNGKPQEITPNEYWDLAKQFNPQNYDPEKWAKAAKDAGFTYAVLTTKHHNGFALWPSKYGNFNTSNYMGGRDLIKPYVEALRHKGLKVGLYFSGPDWHFDKDYMSFLYGGARNKNPELPNLGPDLKPRELHWTDEQIKQHQADYAAMVKGQVEELLTNYGKIDLLWFDGKPGIPNGDKAISLERIRELQPGIVVNPRMHGHGDFITFERTLKTDKVQDGWAEFCNTWANNWSYVEQPMRANGFVLGQLAKCRSLGINYLLGIGPKSDGELSSDAYKNMVIVGQWMKTNGQSIKGTKPLTPDQQASVPAVRSPDDNNVYLFAIPEFPEGKMYEQARLPPKDETLTLRGVAKPASVKLLGDNAELAFDYKDQTLTVQLPASKRTNLVDVVRVEVVASSASK
jgi:alpha-L-fucosidase